MRTKNENKHVRKFAKVEEKGHQTIGHLWMLHARYIAWPRERVQILISLTRFLLFVYAPVIIAVACCYYLRRLRRAVSLTYCRYARLLYVMLTMRYASANCLAILRSSPDVPSRPSQSYPLNAQLSARPLSGDRTSHTMNQPISKMIN